MERIIKVKGRAILFVAKNMVDIIMELRNVCLTHKQAMEENKRQTSSLVAILEKFDFTQEEIKTKYFSIDKVYYQENHTDTPKVKGYQFKHQMKVTLPLEYERLNKILDQLAESELTLSYSLGYKVDQLAQYQQEGMKRAMKDARNKAELLAACEGVEIKKVVNICYPTDEFCEPSVELYRKSQGPIEYRPEDEMIVEEVLVSYEIA